MERRELRFNLSLITGLYAGCARERGVSRMKILVYVVLFGNGFVLFSQVRTRGILDADVFTL